MKGRVALGKVARSETFLAEETTAVESNVEVMESAELASLVSSSVADRRVVWANTMELRALDGTPDCQRNSGAVLPRKSDSAHADTPRSDSENIFFGFFSNEFEFS